MGDELTVYYFPFQKKQKKNLARLGKFFLHFCRPDYPSVFHAGRNSGPSALHFSHRPSVSLARKRLFLSQNFFSTPEIPLWSETSAFKAIFGSKKYRSGLKKYFDSIARIIRRFFFCVFLDRIFQLFLFFFL